jgi:hypothetical protein
LDWVKLFHHLQVFKLKISQKKVYNKNYSLEFPLQRQYALARVAILEEFERGRVILREGHRAEKFYLIVDGVSKLNS